MKYHIQQTIQINMIKINSIANSSVFQIGSAGIIKPYSTLNNSGGFTEPAPPATPGTVGTGFQFPENEDDDSQNQ